MSGVHIMALKNSKALPEPVCYVYVLACNDGSLYTGMTTDLKRRLSEHQKKSARCKFTRRADKHPLRLGAAWVVSGTRGAALTLEHYIKQLHRTEKLGLLAEKKMLRTMIDRDALALPCDITPYQGDLYDLEESL